ncbi:unnamed protein product [Hapterophycus canaliculatus]
MAFVPRWSLFGDCCACDCDSSSYACGIYGYDCLDPASTCSSSSTWSTITTNTDDDGRSDDDDDGSDDDDDGEDYADRDFGDSTTGAIPVNQQEAWAGDTSDPSFSKAQIGAVIVLSTWGFCMLGWGLFAACGFARRRCFEEKKDGATRGKTARAYSVKSWSRRSRPRSDPLAASVAAGLAIHPDDTEEPPPTDKTSIYRFGSARQGSRRGVHLGAEERKEEKAKIDPTFYGSSDGGGGGSEMKREDADKSSTDGARGDAGDDDVAAEAATADAADDDAMAAASDDGAEDGVTRVTEDDEGQAGTAAEHKSSSEQPAVGVAAAGGGTKEGKPPGGDTAVDDGDT